MEERKPGPDGGPVKKLRLSDGSSVGIRNLAAILSEVAGLELTNSQSLRDALLARVKTANYVPSGAEREYASALLREYRRKYEGAGEAGSDARRRPPGR
jgi:hypothetical protein